MNIYYNRNIQNTNNKIDNNYYIGEIKSDKNKPLKAMYNYPNIKSKPNIFNNNISNQNINKKLELNTKNSIKKTKTKNIDFLNKNNNNSNLYYYLKNSFNNNFKYSRFKRNNAKVKPNSLSYKNLNNFKKNKGDEESTYNQKNNQNINSKSFVNDKSFLIKKNKSFNYNKNEIENSHLNNVSVKNDSISNADNSNELSEIANEIVKIIQVKKNLRNSNSFHKLKIGNKKINLTKNNKDKINHLSNKNIRTSPKNFTFKTVFVNNFCLMPMNSSFISKNKRYSNKKIYFTNNNNQNNQNDFNIINKDNLSNYKNPIIFKEEKDIHYKSQIKKNNKKAKKININDDNNSFFIELNNKKNSKTNINEIFRDNGDLIKNKINKAKNTKNNINKNNLKENGFNEDYYYTTMDFSNLDIIKGEDSNIFQNINSGNNSTSATNNKKHIKFDLTKNTTFIYEEKDLISKYTKIPIDNKNKTKPKNNNIKIKLIPIIKKYDKKNIKIDENYIFKENLDESDILSESIKLFDDIDL